MNVLNIMPLKCTPQNGKHGNFYYVYFPTIKPKKAAETKGLTPWWFRTLSSCHILSIFMGFQKFDHTLVITRMITFAGDVKENACVTVQYLFQTTHNSKLLQEALMPVSALDLGGSLQFILELRQKWNDMKPQFQVKKYIAGFG